MTSSPKPSTWKRWPASSWIPILAFLLLFLASAHLGLSDDESYYWVLAQKPALGYAYHPPMVAWMIFVAQKLLGWVAGPSSGVVVRFFSCLSMALLFALGLDWLKKSGSGNRPVFSALALASLAGVFGLGWMMVPDVPLFLGWMLAFWSSWQIAQDPQIESSSYVALTCGVCLAILGKISGVAVPFSALVAVLIGPNRKNRWAKTFLAAAIGTILALIPIVIWNSQHQWLAILYQLRNRQEGAGLSFKRYLRFWAIELFAAGPVLVFYCFSLVKRAFSKSTEGLERSVLRFIAVWMLPAGIVYCLQPLVADFKPHWAFIVWLPGALALAWEVGRRRVRFAAVQIGYGLALVAVILVSLQFPLLSMAFHRFQGKNYDPRLDVTNDLYGWGKFAKFIEARRGPDGTLPYITASRYQTASQAAAALGSVSHVTLLPRDLQSRDEWPMLPISKGIGPSWPELTQSVIYVGDNRYDAPPDFPSSHCIQLATLSSHRHRLLAKRILVWECKPLN